MSADPDVGISLRFRGDTLDPDAVSAALQVSPTRARRKGETFHTPSGTAILARTGLWSVRVEREAPGDLDEKISTLLAGLSGDLAVWKQLCEVLQGDIFCGVFLTEESGVMLKPETMLAIGQRGLTLDLDIYAPDESDDP
ncbi:DUF4279 domain-containing protein [Bosea sp. (in: a-proteobacteria)]|jgi:hypothetical protein|uniref:DUF4279 domain-containing protein n=1 Tax=Bosea sp. (in: a-proteobacteria) TaxID=1871050 RepID=UPI003F6EC474